MSRLGLILADPLVGSMSKGLGIENLDHSQGPFGDSISNLSKVILVEDRAIVDHELHHQMVNENHPLLVNRVAVGVEAFSNELDKVIFVGTFWMILDALLYKAKDLLVDVVVWSAGTCSQ